ncbi:MAG: ABC transporter permease, partial [Candidatus Caldatribacteriaceae bacterium]
MGKDKILALSVVIFIFLVLSITNPGSFLSSYNMEALLEYATTYFVAGIGLTFVIMIGSIDLSIGSLLSLFTVIFVLFLNALGFWAYLLVLLLGVVLGLANGIIFTRLKIPSFIGTFGAAGVYQSLA